MEESITKDYFLGCYYSNFEGFGDEFKMTYEFLFNANDIKAMTDVYFRVLLNFAMVRFIGYVFQNELLILYKKDLFAK